MYGIQLAVLGGKTSVTYTCPDIRQSSLKIEVIQPEAHSGKDSVSPSPGDGIFVETLSALAFLDCLSDEHAESRSTYERVLPLLKHVYAAIYTNNGKRERNSFYCGCNCHCLLTLLIYHCLLSTTILVTPSVSAINLI